MQASLICDEDRPNDTSPVVVKVWPIYHCSCPVPGVRQVVRLTSHACFELTHVFKFFNYVS